MTIAAPAPRTVQSNSAAAYFTATSLTAHAFFTGRADDIARACEALASCFQRGGRLLVCGDGAQSSDVSHVVVEFLHPVVVGKRALPALALPEIEHGSAARTLVTIARSDDALLLLAAASLSASSLDLLAIARDRGLTTIVLLAGESQMPLLGIGHLFAVPAADPCIVQETHEMLYHILWELVHVFLDHRTTVAAVA